MMEPAAPGTEDEIKPTLLTSLNKKENEQERLLSITARLPSGKLGNVFELNFYNGSEYWYCNLCECPIMGRVYHHEIGKRHTNNMQKAGNNPVVPSLKSEPEPPLQIAPGEPVPPGFEGEMRKVAQIQERLDAFTVGPLIGLEYLFELIEYDREKEPSYACLLCNKRGDPRTVIAHLASYNHVIQYIQRYFVTCHRALSPYITKQYKRNWQTTVQKIAEAIEQKFGRLKPYVVQRETFEANRSHYQNMVASGPHCSEKSGVTFEEFVDKEQLTKTVVEDVSPTYSKITSDMPVEDKKARRSPSPPVVAKPKKPKPTPVSADKRRSYSSVSSISSSELSDFDVVQQPPIRKEKIVEVGLRNSRTKSPPFKRQRSNSSYRRYGRRSRSPRSSSPHKRSERLLLPWQRSDYIRSRDSQTEHNKQKTADKMEEFKKLAAAIESDMERLLKHHEKSPEKHPQYNDEWKKFWNKRYKELQGEGKDPQTYDFKPEWIEFWNKRMVELHHQEIKVKKDALRKRLGLPEQPAPICFKITGKKPGQKEHTKESSTKLAPMASTPDQDPDVIVIEDKDDDTVSSRRSHSPWESEHGSSSHPSRDKSRERSQERIRTSRERSRGRKRRSRSRRRSRERERSWRDRDHMRDYIREKPYYREPYRKSELPDYIKPPRVLRDVTKHPVMSPSHIPHRPEPEHEPEDDGEINIVGVLRLLTAVEEKLGSLGPKVIDLLSQALAMEKAEANSSESLLDNEVNCVLFETVKEKLKGQLLAGLVDYNQEKAFKNAIKKIASLIHFAGERKKEREKLRMNPIKVPGVGTVDKAAIAKQIATALVLQGKTDVSQIELEQLINAVVGMAEASRNSSRPMTTASFLQQLSQQKFSISSSAPPAGPLMSALQSTNIESTSSTNNMEGLSDSDLQTLLQNFKDLCTDEQHSLISYLKKLEAREPERVERLRKFVNLDPGSANSAAVISEKVEEKSSAEHRSSPFSSRAAGLNPTVEDGLEEEEAEAEEEISQKTEKVIAKISLDSDDDDYSFEEVFKVAKQNVKEKEEKEEKAKAMLFKTEDFDLSNAKSLIANIMGQIKTNSSESSFSASNLLGLGIANTPSTAEKSPIVIPPQISQNLDQFSITVNSLADTVSNAQKVKLPDSGLRPNIIPHPQAMKPSLSQPVMYAEQNAYMPRQLNPQYRSTQQFDRSNVDQLPICYPSSFPGNNSSANQFNNRPRPPGTYNPNYGGKRW